MDLVSIIIPHYKVDITYLKECINSIVAQTYFNLEIIIVDDGNEENLAKEIDDLALMDKRIHVKHQENQGVSVARNTGLEMANGQWIMFCDPDDWMALNKVEDLLNVAKKHRADIVLSRFYKLINDTDTKADCNKEFVVKSDSEIEKLIRKLLMVDGSIEIEGMFFKLAVIWGAIYSRATLNEVRFPKGMHPIEDEIFNLYAFKQSRKIVFLGKKLHYYRNNTEIGVMRNFQANALCNYQYGEKARDDFIKKYYGKQEEYFNKNEIALRSIKILVILCKSYFFNNKNLDSYTDRKKALQEYICNNMLYLENIQIGNVFGEGFKFKYLFFFSLIKWKIYFPLEICWNVMKIRRI